jgi:acyl phosphate:glycerol-3-phosphate acyltransferase
VEAGGSGALRGVPHRSLASAGVVVLGLALVRDLVGWVPRSATAVGVVAGPAALLGYLVGAIPYRSLLGRRRRSDDPALAAIAAGLATLLVATVAWDVAEAATPGAQYSSAVGVFSNQAVGAWVSVALWTGAAAVVGHLAPVWRGFRGGDGVAPAVALTFAYSPVVFAVAAGAFLAATAATGRPRLGLLACLPPAVTFAYAAWIADLPSGWGVTHGPELTLWVAVVAGVLLAGNWHRRDEGTSTRAG